MYILCAAGSAAPPASHSPSGLKHIACHAVRLMGSLKRWVGSSSLSMNGKGVSVGVGGDEDDEEREGGGVG